MCDIMYMFLMSDFLTALQNGTLSQKEAFAMQTLILSGSVSTKEIIQIFELMQDRFPTKAEMLGFVQASRQKGSLIQVDYPVLDTCGTGGDGLHTFNISTVSSLVLARLGVKVAKHGNKSASSKCGAADVMDALGVKIDISADKAVQLLDEVGMAFLWAPLYHPAFRFVKEARSQFGQRTYFNFLGPLLNPAGAQYQVIGVSAAEMIPIMGEVLMETGSRRVLLVRSSEGMDEISPSGVTYCDEYMLRDVALAQVDSDLERFALEKHLSDDPYIVRTFTVDPKVTGMVLPLESILGGDISTNKDIAQKILRGNGTDGQVAAVLLNAAAGLLVMGKAADFQEAINMVAEVLQAGEVWQTLQDVIRLSNER